MKVLRCLKTRGRGKCLQTKRRIGVGSLGDMELGLLCGLQDLGLAQKLGCRKAGKAQSGSDRSSAKLQRILWEAYSTFWGTSSRPSLTTGKLGSTSMFEGQVMTNNSSRLARPRPQRHEHLGGRFCMLTHYTGARDLELILHIIACHRLFVCKLRSCAQNGIRRRIAQTSADW